MITLSTNKPGQRNIYTRTDTDSKGRVINTKESDVRVLQSLLNGKTFFTVIDSEGQSVLSIHTYVNEMMVRQGRSTNSRRKSAHVLAKLQAFCELLNLSVENLSATDVSRLVAFLQGTGRTQCSNASVNAYLGVIREFFDSAGIKCEPLFARHLVTKTSVQENDFKVENVTYMYDCNLPVDSRKQEKVPKYISMDEYICLIEIARKHNDWNGIMLMHLMFRYGMRLGECLGLTDEDFTYYRIRNIDVPTLIVRNRLSDAPFQNAKRKLTPRQKSDYEGLPYIKQWRDDDYSHYYLTEDGDFVDAFVKFMAQTRERCEKDFASNYKSCEADVVYESTFKEKGLKKNHYIFVNRLGKRLSGQLWGLTLKKYFREAGIRIDAGRKENNLSHRFRHGFAMMHARFMDPPVPVSELQKMMHHRNIASTMIYYNPTEEDEYEYKTKMQNKFYDNNPRLKAITAEFLADVMDDNGADTE